MKPKTLFSTAIALSIGLVFNASDAHAQSYYSQGHGDIGLAYEDGVFAPHWHIGAGSIVNGSPLDVEGEYEPEDLIAVVGTTRGSASGSANYLGVSTGTSVYVAGSSGWQPNLGFGAEELDAADWSSPITVTLTSWTLPSGGDFALYTTNSSGETTVDVFLSTYDPATANVNGIGENMFQLLPGSHNHFAYGFTAPGYYELTFEFSATHATDGIVTGSGTYGFEVIPEPSTYALVALAGVGLVWTSRKRLRAAR